MENVIQTAPQAVIPALYKAAAVSVIALSLAGIGALTGVLPVKRADAPHSVIGAAPAAPAGLAAPAALIPALPTPVAPSAAPAPVVERAMERAPERAPKPRVIRTSSRQLDEPTAKASPVSTHPVAVSASGSDSTPYGQAPHGQPPYGQQPYGQQPYGQTRTQPSPQTAPVSAPVRAACHSCGTVESIREIEKAGEGSGLGMAGGAIGGAVVGKQFGNGRGRDALTILGAIGGGFAGHQVEKNIRTVKSYEVQVRMEDGSLRSLPSTTPPNWRAGDRVKVEGGSISLNYS